MNPSDIHPLKNRLLICLDANPMRNGLFLPESALTYTERAFCVKTGPEVHPAFRRSGILINKHAKLLKDTRFKHNGDTFGLITTNDVFGIMTRQGIVMPSGPDRILVARTMRTERQGVALPVMEWDQGPEGTVIGTSFTHSTALKNGDEVCLTKFDPNTMVEIKVDGRYCILTNSQGILWKKETKSSV